VGQYVPGYEAQAGLGVRIPEGPSKDEVMRWGYFEVDASNDPLNGWYFGADSQGVFVCEVSGGQKEKVYQDQWNVNVSDGSRDAENNPSGFELYLSKGNIFQIRYVYYGYGPVKMSILTDDGKVCLHEFTHDGSTSVKNTNLPINVQLDNNSTTSDALDLFVGGRQFSVIGPKTTNQRRGGHYRDILSGIDDTKWHPVVSLKLKDGTDIGSKDFTDVLTSFARFETDTDNSAYRWQVRTNTSPVNPSWETPSSHVSMQDETAVKIDTSATSIQDGNGDPTGVFVDGGTLTSGSNNKIDIQQKDTSGRIVANQTATVVVRAVPASSGEISETFVSWKENW